MTSGFECCDHVGAPIASDRHGQSNTSDVGEEFAQVGIGGA